MYSYQEKACGVSSAISSDRESFTYINMQGEVELNSVTEKRML